VPTCRVLQRRAAAVLKLPRGACRRPCQRYYHFAARMVPLKTSQRIGSLFERPGPVDHTPELAGISITFERRQNFRGHIRKHWGNAAPAHFLQAAGGRNGPRVPHRGRIGETYNIGGNAEKNNLEVMREIGAILDELMPVAAAHERRYALDTR